ncbi:MAG: NAD-dependent epimerase/dehydratase family protein [Alphaproteobacteria bacterium]|mgnify:CR=1 FL=1|jgi:UDP-glucuronate 4-epimerase|nr:NAD-dependent epimerase/dehydratase family protein [Alphaproteobacteria bacterium]MBT4020080.1 NAD-dependent epimerase/dehydratase family protein [Alphaproteobacteria bacterium]MBT4965360.1 NAD-dependent epimerase/dehydratase family protein [Alphaproteobacteria bacterium]MBT5158144.1 NAD-dependent epimerase/dehydratase family protein [Alphaproteobacteria bacterium]MBT5919675.1 NAD-dependent epimerase/dehydratase family protein [Alphaproteobacteria bacterium]
MTILVTGAAGFIGSHVCIKLLERGEKVLGFDNLNDYYDVSLKEARLARFQDHENFTFEKLNIADRDAVEAALKRSAPIRKAVHLAAQAGVRYSLTNPYAYIETNLMGHTVILEACRHAPNFEHLVYASSSSVYGGNKKQPFSVEDRVDNPVSLYAATKKADELISHSYSHLYRIPATGLRFFTVYGPWGRPDMALWIFTKAIFAGEPIPLFNGGDMQRDFTYVDDIVDGTIQALDKPPVAEGDNPPHRVFNIGNHRSEELMKLVDILEKEIGKKAERQLLPMQDGDVKETYADISAIQEATGYQPHTSIEEGIPAFVKWYRDYHGV